MYVRNKNPFFSFRVIILIVVAITVVTIIAASGILFIPDSPKSLVQINPVILA